MLIIIRIILLLGFLLLPIRCIASLPEKLTIDENITKSEPLIDVEEIGRPFFHTFTSKDGLPGNLIMSTAFDNQGYLWVGTSDGAARYNGRSWVVENMPKRAISNRVIAILPTSDNSIWFATRGAGLFKLKDGQWTTFDTSSGLPSNVISSLLETKQNGRTTLWVGTNNGLAYLTKDKWEVYNDKSGLPNNFINCLLETKQTTQTPAMLWVGTRGGLACLVGDKWTIYNDKTGLLDNTVNCLLESVDKNISTLWVGTKAGLACLENNQWTTNNIPAFLLKYPILALAKTSLSQETKTLWIATNGGGLARLENHKLTIYDTNSGLPNNSVRNLLHTTNSSPALWIGTAGGLAKLEPDKWLTYDVKSGLPDNVVLSLLETSEPNSTMWIGTNGGGLAHLENGKWIVFNKDNSLLPANAVNCLLEDSTKPKALWIGTNTGGLAHLENNKWTIYNTKNSGLPNDVVTSLLETRSINGDYRLLVATFGGGLAQFENGKWTVFNSKNSPLPSDNIIVLLETSSINKKKVLWVGTDLGGLARLEDDKWTVYNTKSELPSNGILSLLETTINDDHILWVGTNGGGVAKLDLKTSQVDQTKWSVISDTTKPALPNNVVYQIRKDVKNQIYFFTNKGICRLSLLPKPEQESQYKIYTFTVDDGLPILECNSGASLVDKEGRIWAGTVAGAVMFDPAKEVEDIFLKPLHIEKALVTNNNLSIFNHSLLNYNENNLVFEFTLLSYHRESDTVYQTRLLGFNDEFTEWLPNNKREFTNLGEGKYIFEVLGKDYAGNVSSASRIAFEIKAAPWRTWWAYTIYAILVLALGYGTTQYRIHSLSQRNILLEEKVSERTKALVESENRIKNQAKELAEKNEQLDKQNEQLDKKILELDKKNNELSEKNLELIASQQRADRIFSALAEALPGTVLDEKYRLDEKIGSGGFGAVFKATHLGLNSLVAVKIFRPLQGNDSPEALERFLREGISACRVNHPNSVTVLDSGISSDGIAFMVMELLKGHTLTEELREKGKLSLNRCAEILLPVCDVLAVAHSEGILHRDIKPDNIFLHQGRNGEIVKVVDFGVAKFMESKMENLEQLTESGIIIGTPAYIAPERYRSKPYDGRSDVYSLGIILYEMLSGRAPFEINKKDPLAGVLLRLTQDPKPLREVKPDISEDLEKVVMQAIAKDQSNRPTAKELAQNLATVLGIKYNPPSDLVDNQKRNKANKSSAETVVLDVYLEETVKLEKQGNTIVEDRSTNPNIEVTSAAEIKKETNPGIENWSQSLTTPIKSSENQVSDRSSTRKVTPQKPKTNH